MQVCFSPTAKGAASGQLTFTTNAPGSPQTVGNRRREEEADPQREVAQANGYPDLKLRVEQKAPATSGYTAFSRGATYTRGTRD